VIPLPPDLDPIPARLLARALGVKAGSLAKASHRGRGPTGRFLLADNAAAYPRASVETWLRDREAGAPARLEAARARAAKAREAKRRAA